MKRELMICAVLASIVAVSGCTELGISGETVNFNGNPYDPAFTEQISIADCNTIFKEQYPGEDKYSCSITKVDMQTKTFDCKCMIEKGVI
jgi:hypothetical protein